MKQSCSKKALSREEVEAYIDTKLAELFPESENKPGAHVETVLQYIASYTEKHGKLPAFIVVSSKFMTELRHQCENSAAFALRERNGKPHIAGVHVIDPISGNADFLCGR